MCVPAVENEDVTFYLINSNTGTKPVNLKLLSIESLKQDGPVKILVHGWMEGYNSYWYKPTINEYMKKCDDINIITVGWGKLAKNVYYPNVAKEAPRVGQKVGEAIVNISEKYNILLERFHLIGHSLGAHICGFAGKYVISERETKIGRITGLDPALPSFETSTPLTRLSLDDATFVDIIHTDGGGAGFEIALGHVDFYPNGGKKKQNGCSSLNLGCSHKRAPIYFWESINSRDFVAVQAPNFKEFKYGECVNNRRAVMGENVDISLRGDFYLYTNKRFPFAKGAI